MPPKGQCAASRRTTSGSPAASIAGRQRASLHDRRRCVAVEPGLAPVAPTIAGGLHLPNDETGDCHQFTTALATLAQTIGVTFKFDTRIDRLIHSDNEILAVNTSRGALRAEAYVLALGSFTPLLARPLRIRMPVYPVKGYSIAVPIREPNFAPQSTLMDETHKVAITRLGTRIRVGGMAEISGFDNRLHAMRRHTLERSLSGLFPAAADPTTGTFWSGLRPMTPDGTPIVGATKYRNLFINTGHGTLGWTMACGSASVLADQISCVAPAIDAGDLAITRYNSRRHGAKTPG